MAMSKVFYRTPHNYDLDKASDECCVKDWGPSLTVQSQAEEADLNFLMHRYGVTGKFPENPRVPQFMELDGPLDYRTALEYVSNANEAFMEYPAELRARFRNDPQVMLAFVSDRANLEEARKLGLLKPVVAPPAVVPVPEVKS